jgi:hypothetical protein
VTLDEFVAEVCERLRADMQSIRDPEGDVHPALFHWFEGEALRRMKIPRPWFDSDQTKDAMTRAIAAATVMSRPRMIAFATTTYMLVVPADKPIPPRLDKDGQPTARIKDVPGRTEELTVVAFSWDEVRFASALITRDGRNPPTFGEWVAFTPDEAKGAIYEPLMRSMQR